MENKKQLIQLDFFDAVIPYIESLQQDGHIIINMPSGIIIDANLETLEQFINWEQIENYHTLDERFTPLRQRIHGKLKHQEVIDYLFHKTKKV